LWFYNQLLPRLGIGYRVEYDLGLAALLYTFFLANLMNAMFTVGGILNPLWSIAVEEQFYLSWAPLLQRWHRRVPALAGTVAVLSLLLFAANELAVFGTGWHQKLIGQLKFHFMAMGAFAAWCVRHHEQRLWSLPMFSSRWLRWLLLFLLGETMILGRLPWGQLQELVYLLLFPWLILIVGVVPEAHRLRLDSPVTEWLGGISYGLYMLHMPTVYATAFLFERTSWSEGSRLFYGLAFYGVVLGGTIGLAALSHRFLERPFLRLKGRRFGPAPEGRRETAALPLPLPVSPPSSDR
jgi:peptidoglycan/LPS O-acetylase OafA/YrhL